MSMPYYMENYRSLDPRTNRQGYCSNVISGSKLRRYKSWLLCWLWELCLHFFQPNTQFIEVLPEWTLNMWIIPISIHWNIVMYLDVLYQQPDHAMLIQYQFLWVVENLIGFHVTKSTMTSLVRAGSSFHATWTQVLMMVFFAVLGGGQTAIQCIFFWGGHGEFLVFLQGL